MRLSIQLGCVVLALLGFLPLAAGAAADATSSSPRFVVSLANGIAPIAQDGRLFVILSPTNRPEPRLSLTRTGLDAPQALARDVLGLAAGRSESFDKNFFAFPRRSLLELPPGDYFVQALFDCNPDIRLPDAPGNLYSAVQKIRLPQGPVIKLELTQQILPEKAPAESAQIKYVELNSKLLSQFHGRRISLRAGIILPRDYEREPAQRYPLWIRIGGFGARYTSVSRLMAWPSAFRRTWVADDTPGFILLQLDGAGPLGDPYYVNSANNGPYGDALVQELIPFVEKKFRAIGEPRARVLSGTSTGGWVSLALQIFYPDFFNGAWSSCPDPVDFRAFELIDIYRDDDAYVNRYGNERPSERDLNGEVRLTVRREVGMENLLGLGNSFAMSGQQWGAWNAVGSPRGPDGRPLPLWDPQSGKLNHIVAQAWRKYDLRIVLEENWATLGPKLRGKLHIAAGEADNFYLNNAVHLLDRFLATADPPFEGKISYGPGKGHGWSDLSLEEMLAEMSRATSTR